MNTTTRDRYGKAFTLCLGLALVLAVFGNFWTAQAGCRAPTIWLSGKSGAPGTTVNVKGEWFIGECNDTNIGGIRPAQPAKNVKILFVQGKRREQIGTTAADSKFEISLEIRIPPTATPGKAFVMAEFPGLTKPTQTLPVEFSVTSKSALY